MHTFRHAPRLTAVLATLLAGLSLSGAAQAALIDRGGGLIYDDVLNLTWLQDANYARTSGYDADGLMTWDNAVAWAANLSYHDSVRGVTYSDWRLPTMVDTGPSGCDAAYSGTDCGFNVQTRSGGTTYSEMAYMYFVNLENQSYFTTTGGDSGAFAGGANPDSTLDNVGPFINLQSHGYWSGLEYAPSTNDAWYFSTGYGSQNVDFKYNYGYAWAVRPGDVAAVPEPGTLMLLGLGLAGLAAARRRRDA